MIDPTSAFDDLFDELHMLITARLEKNISAKQRRRLEYLLLHDTDARRIYREYIQESNALALWASKKHPDNCG